MPSSQSHRRIRANPLRFVIPSVRAQFLGFPGASSTAVLDGRTKDHHTSSPSVLMARQHGNGFPSFIFFFFVLLVGISERGTFAATGARTTRTRTTTTSSEGRIKFSLCSPWFRMWSSSGVRFPFRQPYRRMSQTISSPSFSWAPDSR